MLPAKQGPKQQVKIYFFISNMSNFRIFIAYILNTANSTKNKTLLFSRFCKLRIVILLQCGSCLYVPLCTYTHNVECIVHKIHRVFKIPPPPRSVLSNLGKVNIYKHGSVSIFLNIYKRKDVQTIRPSPERLLVDKQILQYCLPCISHLKLMTHEYTLYNVQTSMHVPLYETEATVLFPNLAV